jgi:hypothetical protein
VNRLLSPIVAVAALALSPAASANDTTPAPPDRGEDVEVTSGVVTALSCAVEAQRTGQLSLLNACPLAETAKGLVVFDVAEKQIYRLSKKAVFRYELESAVGGGSIDLEGVVASVDGRVAVIDVDEYEITKRPAAGAFKGCL